MPGTPIVYWLPEKVFETFDNRKISSVITTREGMINSFFKELVEYKKYNREVDADTAMDILHNHGLDIEDLSVQEYTALLNIIT